MKRKSQSDEFLWVSSYHDEITGETRWKVELFSGINIRDRDYGPDGAGMISEREARSRARQLYPGLPFADD